MKILIGLIVLAAIYFIYKKMSGGKEAPVQAKEPSSAASTTSVESSNSEAPETPVTAPPSTAAAANDATTPADATTSSATSSSVAGIAALDNPPPLEHLFGLDRRAGKALRALGINDLNALLNASSDKLEVAGFDTAAAKILQAQAALTALPGVTPQEISVLANSGVDSIASLAKQSPSKLLEKVARANRNVGALKTPPGVQQLQRLISSAKAAA